MRFWKLAILRLSRVRHLRGSFGDTHFCARPCATRDTSRISGLYDAGADFQTSAFGRSPDIKILYLRDDGLEELTQWCREMGGPSSLIDGRKQGKNHGLIEATWTFLTEESRLRSRSANA